MKRAFFLFLMIIPASLLVAAPYHVEEISFYPNRIYIGDEATCRLIIGKEAGNRCTPPDSETLPQSGNVKIRSVTVQDDGDRAVIDILFSPYTIGFFYLPALHCGDFEITGIRVSVLSLFGKGESPSMASAAPVYRLHGLYAVLAVTACLVMLIPVFLIAFLPGVKKRAGRFFAGIFRRNPYRAFSVACRNLEKSVDVADSRQLYNELTYIFRRYLTVRTGEDFFIVMTREMKDRLAVYLDDSEACSGAAEIMVHSDAVRFGSKTEGISREKKDLTRIQEIVRQIEEKLAGRPGV